MSDKQKWGVVYACISQGQAVTEAGIKFSFAPGCSLFAFLKEAHQHTPVNRVFLVGEMPEGYQAWLTSPEMYKFFRTQKIGHMLDGNKSDDYVARYEHRVSGKKLDVRSIERWLGDGEYTIFQARGAMLLLTQNVASQFPFFKHLAGTPSSTFGMLWQQFNAMEHKKFEPLPEAIRNIIHGSTGQGRIEYFGDNAQGQIPGLFYYDGIFMYAKYTWGLPTEVETHDNLNKFAGKQFARYRISFTVPDYWQHVGPFGVRLNDVWEYPGLHRQGKSFETWVDGAELDALLQVYEHLFAGWNVFLDWNITILERIVYKNPKDCAVKNPLDGVVTRLVHLRGKVEEDARQDAQHATIYKLVRAGLRNIVLHGIGAFNRQAGTRTYIGLMSEVPPDGFIDRNELDDGRVIYILPEEAATSNMSHPEYPACVWGRVRAMMFRHMMAVDYGELVTVRTDAVATKKPMPAWEKGTKVGELRRKWAVEKKLKAPATARDFDDLQRKILEKAK